ncbi:sugar transferase [Xenophilus arseniciresistens]|uniref:Sugar transferase n=1 Tax=Xenophilus arseniciresistens TaxID=1283306 RepID=A0AAE3N5A0_9BURK|nr:sugar transferase [Xenophilus arseniciresistens]MDA7415486.1 sugar transferase [Xenophilus arseniciresistens]
MKRGVDLFLAFIAILILFFPLLIISLLIFVKMGSPVFFVQTRSGMGGAPFRILKFRTMANASSIGGAPLLDGQRITPLGDFLRSTSLDELPELWNVIRGDMSLVGPRPLLMDYLPLYSDEQARRHEVRPGITGWAQINGRNTLSWEEKFKLDVWYVDNRTLWLDIKILWLTVRKVLVRDGISAAGEATMPRFTGARVEPKQ